MARARRPRGDESPSPAATRIERLLSGQATDGRPEVRELLDALQRDHETLGELLESAKDSMVEEDLVYRFWHQSLKVYAIQEITTRFVDALRAVAPNGRGLNPLFEEIIAEGTGRRFELADNDHWPEVARPMVEAFFHARYMVEMAVKYGRELDGPPALMPSGWAALLYLYELR